MLTEKTRSAEQIYLDSAMRRSLAESPIQELAGNVNLNINMTINHYGTGVGTSNQTTAVMKREPSIDMVANPPRNSMETLDLLESVDVNQNLPS